MFIQTYWRLLADIMKVSEVAKSVLQTYSASACLGIYTTLKFAWVICPNRISLTVYDHEWHILNCILAKPHLQIL